MGYQHTCYMEGGSIINAFTGCIIERPAILVSKESDMMYGWGNIEDVEKRFDKYVSRYAKAGMTDEANDLMLIELSEYKIDRNMACYVIRRTTEFTATGFIMNLCRELLTGTDPITWLKAEMERVPINLNEKEWK